MGIRDLFFSIFAQDKTGTAFDSVGKRLAHVEGAAARVEERLDRAGRAMQRWGAIGSVATLGVLAAFRGVVSAYDDAARAQAKVETAIRSTGGAANLTAAQLYEEAAALQAVTRFDGDLILNEVTAQLLTFKALSGDVFLSAQRAALDLATVLDSDLQGASIMLGKALENPEKGLTALSRAGVTFTDAQRAVIEELQNTGDIAGAQRAILEEIATSYGGQAEAARAAGAGVVDAWRNTWGDVQEVVGEVVTGFVGQLLPTLQSVAQGFQDMSPTGQEAVVVFGALAIALPPVIAGLGLIVSGIAAIGAPVALAIAGITGLVAAVALLWPEKDKLAASITASVDALTLEAAASRGMAASLQAEAQNSSTATEQKYLEVRARYENAKAALAEARAIAMGSAEYLSVRRRLDENVRNSATGGLMEHGPGPTGSINRELYDMGAIGRRQSPETESLLAEHSRLMESSNMLAGELANVEAQLAAVGGAGTTAAGGFAEAEGALTGDTGTGTGAGTGGAGTGGGRGGGGGLIGAMRDLTSEAEAFRQSPMWSSVKDNFRALIAEGQSWGDTWRNVLGDALDRLFDLAFAPAWDRLFQNLQTWFDAGAGGGGGGGGILGGIGSAVRGLFGFDTGGAFTVSGRAGIDRNTATVNLSQGERVEVLRRGDAPSPTVNVYIQTPDARSFQASRAQIGAQIGRAVAAGQRAQ